MSLRIVPTTSHATSTTNTSTTNPKKIPSDRGAPSAPGLPDILRSSLSTPSPSSLTPSSTHPLETRLKSWTSTQQTLQHTLLRRTYGLAEPLRRGMELKMVRDADAFRPSVLGPASGVHSEILEGRDCEISWEDVFDGRDGVVGGVVQGDAGGTGGWTEEMERMVGMGKW